MTHEIFQGASPEEVRNEQAKKAVRTFRAMQHSLTGYARALTGDKGVSVELATGTPRTDGKKIYFRPPLALGDLTPHERGKCDRRDRVTLQQLCAACNTREQVMITIIHEIAHIAFGTFDDVTDKAKREVIERAVAENGTRYAKMVKERLASAPASMKWSYLGLANLINEYLPTLVNALEDARVDSEMFKARKGTKAMFDAQVQKIFADGVEQADGTVRMWSEYPLNSQALVGIFVLACGYKFNGWFHPEVEKALKDARLQELTQRIKTTRSANGTYELSFAVLARLRELGFCKNENDPDEEPEEGDDDQQDQKGDSDDQAEPPQEEESEGESGDEESGSQESPGDSGSSDATESPSEPVDGSNEGDPGDEGVGDETDESADQSGPGAESSGADGDDQEEGESADSDGTGDSADNYDATDESGDDGTSSEDSGSDSDVPESDSNSSSDAGESDPESTGEGRSGVDEEVEAETSDSDGLSTGSGQEDSSGEETTGLDDLEGSDGLPCDDESDAGDSPGESEEDHSDGSDQQSDSRESDGLAESASSDDGDDSQQDGEGNDEALPVQSDESDEGTEDYSDEGDLDVSDSSEEDSEPIDTGADDGMGGVETPNLPDYGSPDEVSDDVKLFGKHDVTVESTETPQDTEAIETAIVQSLYFEKPSTFVAGVREHTFGAPVIDGGKSISLAWKYANDLDWAGRSLEKLGIDCDTGVPESVLGPVLLETRKVFSDNARADFQRHLRSGRINGRVLGKRAWSGDPRLFQKKRLPGKRSYAVLIGIDISGSTMGLNIALAKRAAMAQAELCYRVGVDFAVYAHTANGSWTQSRDDNRLYLDIYEIKSFGQPWDTKAQEALARIGSDAENLDGHTIEYYRKKIERHSATDKIILYYSDGKMPAANHDEELEILQREIQYCKNRGITLMGVGIRTDSPRRHGLDTVQVDSDADLVKVARHLEKVLVRAR